eukprot:CAMPEP_0168556794 /NCGR_PEP_ID=MMETSP0413-20121227/9075_1 /TAXON_ID=136452 /ORGANISM="Filamoeba nolandi, Strain NC-AS-23-1" /LENGTH=68 /DNA_ID=CAMNT_0008587769 /DNA_START=2117 /DNA_END=2319 /DNA_ORIENTATION=-
MYTVASTYCILVEFHDLVPIVELYRPTELSPKEPPVEPFHELYRPTELSPKEPPVEPFHELYRPTELS